MEFLEEPAEKPDKKPAEKLDKKPAEKPDKKRAGTAVVAAVKTTSGYATRSPFAGHSSFRPVRIELTLLLGALWMSRTLACRGGAPWVRGACQLHLTLPRPTTSHQWAFWTSWMTHSRVGASRLVAMAARGRTFVA